MSRRRAFETSLSSSSSAQPTSTSRKPTLSSPPSITPPDPEHSAATVPTTTTTDSSSEDKATPAATPPEIDDTVQCFICAEPITFWSVGVCGHRTCHVCAIRLRLFYKKKECTFCKTSLPSLLFSRSPSTPFPSEHHVPPSPPKVIAAALARADKLEKGQKWDEGLTLPGTLDVGKFEFADEKLGVVFEDEDMMEATLLLLRFNCPAEDCAYMATGWDTLEQHTLATHGKVMCKLCRAQLNRFAHEQVLYPPHLLGLHDPSRVKVGHRAPRPRGQKEEEMVRGWEAAHPMCEFCHEAFFGPDELFAHMRTKHEECFVCKDLGERNVYFQNYEMLATHFNQDHFPCKQPSCLEKKFVVFGTEMDLRAHMIEDHGEQMSARDRAQARQLPTGFLSHVDSSSTSSRGNRPNRNTDQQQQRQGRGFTLAQTAQAGPSRANGPRDRDLPPHQQQIGAAPVMAPEQAAQQRRQLQMDRQEESKRRRAFETGLTGSAPRQQEDRARLEEDVGVGSGAATPREDVGEATAARHAALLSRVSALTSFSDVKLSSFRSAIRQFRAGESSARGMIDTIYHVLDRDPEAVVGVVREVALLFADEDGGDKERSVLEALNAWRIQQQEQFPALAGSGAPQGLGTNWAGITSGKILNAKRSTHTTSRASAGSSSRTVWDRVEAAAASHPVNRPSANGRIVPGSSSAAAALASTSTFPSLGAGPPSATRPPHSTPWSSGGAGSSSKSPPALTGPIIRSVNFPTAAKVGKAKPPSQAAFPSLPAKSPGMSSEERRALFNKPNAREETIRRITGQGPAPPPAANGWGRGSVSVEDGVGRMALGGGGDEPVVEENSGGSGGGGGKKKGKGKQLLFTVSARP